MPSHEELIRAQFTRQASAFAKSQGHLDEGSLQRLAAASGLNADDLVLDVACGTGMVACAFAIVARHVTGIDLTAAMLDQARALQHRRDLGNLSWELGDATQLPFARESFSLVLSRYAFHHAPDPLSVLREMVRVCRKGGRIVIADGCPAPDKAHAHHRFEKLMDPSHARALTETEFDAILREVGLTKVNKAWDRLDMELGRSLAAAFPNPGDDEVIRRMVRDDVGVDALGLNVTAVGDELRYAYPILIIVAEKTA